VTALLRSAVSTAFPETVETVRHQYQVAFASLKRGVNEMGNSETKSQPLLSISGLPFTI
jgi:hypothetical protein